MSLHGKNTHDKPIVPTNRKLVVFNHSSNLKMPTTHSKEEQDLSVIGNGKPTVVQIHDPGCQLCNRLKHNLDAVKGGFIDTIQFKTAMIVKSERRKLAHQHQVQHVTLLFFDKRDRRVHTLQGVSSQAEIRNGLADLDNL